MAEIPWYCIEVNNQTRGPTVEKLARMGIFVSTANITAPVQKPIVAFPEGDKAKALKALGLDERALETHKTDLFNTFLLREMNGRKKQGQAQPVREDPPIDTSVRPYGNFGCGHGSEFEAILRDYFKSKQFVSDRYAGIDLVHMNEESNGLDERAGARRGESGRRLAVVVTRAGCKTAPQDLLPSAHQSWQMDPTGDLVVFVLAEIGCPSDGVLAEFKKSLPKVVSELIELVAEGDDKVKEILKQRREAREEAERKRLAAEAEAAEKRRLAELKKFRDAFVKQQVQVFKESEGVHEESIRKITAEIAACTQKFVDLQKQLETSSMALMQVRAANPNITEKFGKEFDQILTFAHVKGMRGKGNELVIETDEMYCDYNGKTYLLGEFDIYFGDATTKYVRILNRRVVELTGKNDRQHPHVLDPYGTVCLNNAQQAITELIAKREYALATQYILDFLERPSFTAGHHYGDWLTTNWKPLTAAELKKLHEKREAHAKAKKEAEEEALRKSLEAKREAEAAAANKEKEKAGANTPEKKE